MPDWVAAWPPRGPASAAGSDLVWVGVAGADEAAAVADEDAGNVDLTLHWEVRYAKT